ncbi:MAG TPA: HAMP domain-containing sensor histidine kinase, partial [Candidatus Krumholzibacteria bacterium]|nr:HAMP domain-containing sensor histidine kinase [Candidatus Krumholzibacteria bacterium]
HATDVTADVIPLRHARDAHTLLRFRVHADSFARELWTDDAVSTVAHEFRNPLASMRSALNVLATGDAGEIAPTQMRFIEAVQRGVERLSRMVDGYLDLGRVRAGELSLERRDEDVRALLDGVVRDFSLCQPPTGARITVDVPERAPRVFVDHDRITQVLLNLVYNAARFTPGDGQVTLRASGAGREALDDDMRVLPFDVLGEPRFTCISVEDEGIGMSADVLAHVFERYRDEGSQPGGGAHLGLHIARTLVDAHDGALRIESRLGQGTTARVLVPSDSRTARMMLRLRHAGDAVEVARAARRSVTVALVEDYELRMEAELPASWARASGDRASLPARVWVIRDGLALVMTCGDLPVLESWLAGACRVGANMTFSGAVRAAAARLLEQRNPGAVRGLEPVRE